MGLGIILKNFTEPLLQMLYYLLNEIYFAHWKYRTPNLFPFRAISPLDPIYNFIVGKHGCRKHSLTNSEEYTSLEHRQTLQRQL